MAGRTPGKRLRRRTIAEVARELGVGSQSLGKWVAAVWATGSGGPTGELTLDERAELKALRFQVAELHKDDEFLGRAAALSASFCQRLTNGRKWAPGSGRSSPGPMTSTGGFPGPCAARPGGH
jgi:transposase